MTMVFRRRSGRGGFGGVLCPNCADTMAFRLLFLLKGGVWDVRQMEPLHSMGRTYEGTLMSGPLEGGPGG